MYKVCEAYTYIETGLESILRMEDSPLLGEADPAVGSLQGEPSFLIAGKGARAASCRRRWRRGANACSIATFLVTQGDNQSWRRIGHWDSG